MASIRTRLALAIALFPGVLAACSDERARDSAASSPPVAGPSTVAPWSADANGGTLFAHVTGLAARRAEAAWIEPSPMLGAAYEGLGYADHRDIRYRSEAAVWHEDGPFELQLFHPGAGSDVPVQIHVVEDGRSHPLAFDAGRFVYGDRVADRDLALPPEAGHAGFRVLYRMNDPAKMDEVVAFLGASYFRLIGPGHVYGVSSRGLAVDIAEPTGEEFPDFVAFWVVRPESDAVALEFYGLLDGPSVTGAYRFELVPGRQRSTGSVLDVEARLFFREDVRKLGVAPLTSMYLHGPMIDVPLDDFRPRVHDSEGLLMLSSRGEWIWRPLTNRPGVRVTSLRDVDPAGFGLVQRARDFEDYLDLEALYHRRPSQWVVPEGGWGGGGVELLELPTTTEFNDNIVAYWSPDDRPVAGDERVYRYRVVTFDDRLADASYHGGPLPGQRLAHVARTRIAWDALPGEVDPPPHSRRRVVVDFEGADSPSLDLGGVSARATTSSGRISDLRVQRLPSGGLRATFALEPEQDRGADMRLFLLDGDRVVTETWSYLWEPDLVR